MFPSEIQQHTLAHCQFFVGQQLSQRSKEIRTIPSYFETYSVIEGMFWMCRCKIFVLIYIFHKNRPSTPYVKLPPAYVLDMTL